MFVSGDSWMYPYQCTYMGNPYISPKKVGIYGFRINTMGTRNLLGQWLNFKLFGITYLVGKIKFQLLFQGPLAEWAYVNGGPTRPCPLIVSAVRIQYIRRPSCHVTCLFGWPSGSRQSATAWWLVYVCPRARNVSYTSCKNERICTQYSYQ